MTVIVETRHDFTLEAYRRVTWGGEPVRIADSAVEVMRESREGFMRLLEREPEAAVYGVTTGYGQMAKQRLDADQCRAHATRPPHAAAASFGQALPERIVRGIVFAPLVNSADGNTAIAGDDGGAVGKAV